MTRTPGWEMRFAETFEAWRRRPFAWGETDCLLWAAAAVQSIAGRDFAAPFAGRYQTALGARRKLGCSVEAMLDRHAPRRPIGFARRGDLALIEDAGPFGGWAAVVGPEGRFAWAPARDGLSPIPLAECSAVWGVG